MDEIYGVHVDSPSTIMELETGWSSIENDDRPTSSDSCEKREKPPLMLEPLFVIFAGATAAMVRVCLFDMKTSELISCFNRHIN